MTEHPTVRKGCNIQVTNENFIIKHVRYTDLKEVMVVTIDGATNFAKRLLIMHHP